MKQHNHLWSNTMPWLLLLVTFVRHRLHALLTIHFTIASANVHFQNFKSANYFGAQSQGKDYLILHCYHLRGLGGVVELMLPMARADRGSRPVYYLPCSDLGQVVNLSLSIA